MDDIMSKKIGARRYLVKILYKDSQKCTTGIKGLAVHTDDHDFNNISMLISTIRNSP